MKIKCNDYLPSKNDKYMTDLGILTLMIHSNTRAEVIKRWYFVYIMKSGTTEYTSYRLAVPLPTWWEEIDKK